MTPYRALLPLTLVFSAACYERADGGAGPSSVHGADAAADAGSVPDDARAERASDPDADAGCTCTGDTPVCLEDGGCAACSGENTAVCPTDQPLCSAAHECVTCVEHRDCKTEAAPTCSAGECVACSNDEGCADRGKICNFRTGECASCTVEREEERCGFNSCDPQTLTCTRTRRESVTICEPCVADSECETDHRCIPMHFGRGSVEPTVAAGVMAQP
jgi:hypothetical protein